MESTGLDERDLIKESMFLASGRVCWLRPLWTFGWQVGFGRRLASAAGLATCRNGPTGHRLRYGRRFGYGHRFGYGRRLATTAGLATVAGLATATG
ncbi:hypothetical protein F2Q69_00058549 [Brassica cretica]|uniref:Uncharacterized protein n=1 Tax=Brassica cretica TaxID=69181 RepID=A0A8S9RCL5_BRACR|nr:hypothetical protein F2Q69_00058549 [Brassica cretica]